MDTGEKRFILDVDMTSLERAPGFDKVHWPDMTDRARGAKLANSRTGAAIWLRAEHAACGCSISNIKKKEKEMDSGTKNKTEGKLHEVKGKLKEKVGQVINDSDLEAEGKSENLAGKVQKKIGQIEEVFEK